MMDRVESSSEDSGPDSPLSNEMLSPEIQYSHNTKPVEPDFSVTCRDVNTNTAYGTPYDSYRYMTITIFTTVTTISI